MSRPAIRVDNVSKRYRIGQVAEKNRTFREAIMNAAALPVQRYRQLKKDAREEETFWALKDVDFEVQPGEVVAVIGRNGAGKSTLLKIMSHITTPTSGRVEILGRVASLLEVGTGFHAELTGRENVVLNGAILGMGRREIESKFDEIVEFAEVGKFIDTPVKRYSSGMYLRLAFAVAAHLEPEILIVDEVLAVGDASFQKKCLGKMQSVAAHGRTVVFVSHNMGAVNQLCPACVWLDEGKIVDQGSTARIVAAYLKAGDRSGGTAEVKFEPDSQKEAQVLRLRLLNAAGEPTVSFNCDEGIFIEYQLVIRERLPGLYGYCEIARKDGAPILVSVSDDFPANPLNGLALGEHTIRLAIPPRLLGHGDYTVYLSFAAKTARNFDVDVPGIVCSFQMDDHTTRRGNKRGGCISTLIPWCLDESQNGLML